MATIETQKNLSTTLNAGFNAGQTPVLPGFPVPEETPTMHVRKRDGGLEPVDVNKIVRAVERCCAGLPHREGNAARFGHS